MSAFPANLFAGSRFAVLGLGRNGWPAARALAAMGAQVVAWDDQPSSVALARDDLSRCAGDVTIAALSDLSGYDALILSPGIPHSLPQPHPAAARARAAGVRILSDAELLFQAVRRAGSHARFIGITGTNGKSTTTALVAHILAEAGVPVAAGGNLGPAALALPLLGDSGAYVLEMSSYMLERLATLHFDAAAMLNLSADHLDRHGDLGGYAAVKRSIFDRQTEDDLAVVGVDDAPSRAIAAWLHARPAPVVEISGPASMALVADASALPGSHNAQNAAAAWAMCQFLGVAPDAIARGIASFPGLPHRAQRVATIDGVTFVNDSKATNADAASRALSCYQRVVWIAGGLAKSGGIEPLASLFPRVAKALLIGRDAPTLAATLASHGVPCVDVGTLEAAVAAALPAARESGADVVLLSPACASFDQFTGFDARGDRFIDLVRGLCTAKAA